MYACSSSRFEGPLNVDMNEITMNLVPYQRLHYLLASQAPILQQTRADPSQIHVPLSRRVDGTFIEVFSKENQLVRTDIRQGVTLACAVLARGRVALSDVRRNLMKLQAGMHFVHWNTEGWKVGLCAAAPVLGGGTTPTSASALSGTTSTLASALSGSSHPQPGTSQANSAQAQAYTLLTLCNNTCIRQPLCEVSQRFHKLYKRKAHMYHYTQVAGFEETEWTEALESLERVMGDYAELEQAERAIGQGARGKETGK